MLTKEQVKDLFGVTLEKDGTYNLEYKLTRKAKPEELTFKAARQITLAMQDTLRAHLEMVRFKLIALEAMSTPKTPVKKKAAKKAKRK